MPSAAGRVVGPGHPTTVRRGGVPQCGAGCILAWLLASLAGCIDERAVGIAVDATVTQDGSMFPEDGSVEDGAVPVLEALTHDGERLYRVSLTDYEVQFVGWFSYSGGSAWTITDIAMDRAGRLWGVTFSEFYRIDPDTTLCTFIGELQVGENCNGLAAVGPGAPGIDENRLVAACETGVYVVDPVSMDVTFLAPLPIGFWSSGDAVFIPGEGLYVTAKADGSNSDVLVLFQLPASNGAIVGSIGVQDIWGLVFWNNMLFGFSSAGGIYDISLTSGAGTTLAATQTDFWGATLAAVFRGESITACP